MRKEKFYRKKDTQSVELSDFPYSTKKINKKKNYHF